MHHSRNHSTLRKSSDVLSDGTGHITIRVHPRGNHSLTRHEEDDLRRRVITLCDTYDTWKHNLPNVREVFKTAIYFHSRYILTYRELLKIREISRERRHLSSVTYWIFFNLPDIREVLWNWPTFELVHYLELETYRTSGMFLESANV